MKFSLDPCAEGKTPDQSRVEHETRFLNATSKEGQRKAKKPGHEPQSGGGK